MQRLSMVCVVAVAVAMAMAVGVAEGAGACQGIGAVASGVHPTVTELNLDATNIVNLTSISGYPALKTLSLNKNLLQVMQLSRLQGADNVKTVHAADNHIRTVEPAPEGITFSQLAELDLSDNHIKELKENDLRGAVNLQRLVLDANPLQALPAEALEGHVTKKGEVSFSDSPLACSCAFEELEKWAKDAHVTLTALCLGKNLCK